MGKEVPLQYLTVDTLAKRIWDLGSGIAVYKKDMTSAFSQLRGDLFDASLMMYKWNDQYFVDLAVAMGLRSAPSCCQRVTNAITHIHQNNGFWLMNCIDDFISAEKWSEVWDSYYSLGKLLNDIGAIEAPKKVSPPDTQVVCLGMLVDTLAMTLSMIPERLVELRKILEKWHTKTETTRKELESLIGKLQFVAMCVRQGHIFIARLLNLLRSMVRNRKYSVPLEARKDIFWWFVYLLKYNGTSIMWYLNKEQVDTVIATDACLRHGCGGVGFGQYYRAQFPRWLQHKAGRNIALLEMYAIIPALRVWSGQLKGIHFKISCDNMACVQLINCGKV